MEDTREQKRARHDLAAVATGYLIKCYDQYTLERKSSREALAELEEYEVDRILNSENPEYCRLSRKAKRTTGYRRQAQAEYEEAKLIVEKLLKNT